MSLAISLGAQAISGSTAVANVGWDGLDESQKVINVYGVFTASGSYTLGGDTLDFTKVTNPIIPSSYVPLQVYIQSQNPSGVSGYLYSWRPGTTLANGKMQVFTSGASGSPHSELAAGAYPVGVTGDAIVFSAVFVRLA
jgi:hypothetical protein